MTEHAEAPRMSGAEFAARRQLLGLTFAELSDRLDVRLDTVQKWERGKDSDPIPYRVPAELDALIAEQGRLARRMVEDGRPIYLRRGDGWALGAAARALEMEPDLMLEWL